MTGSDIYSALSHGGRFSLPYLFKIEQGENTLRLVGNTEAVEYDGDTYLPSNLSYTPPSSNGGVLKGGGLTATMIGNSLPEIFRKADDLMRIQVVGAIANDGTVSPVRIFRHRYGSVTVSNDMEMSIAFDGDDRMSMTFPAAIFDADNNRGNA